MIFAEFATIARNNKFVIRVLRNEPIPSHAYDCVKEIFRDCLRDLTKAANLQSFLPFQTKPGSYLPKKRASPSNDKAALDQGSGPNKNKRRRYDSSKGWFTASGPVRFPLSERVCNRFAQIGSVCRDGNNCTYKHKIFPRDFTPDEKQKIIDYVQSNKDISFAPHIKTEELSITKNTPSSEEQIATAPVSDGGAAVSDTAPKTPK